MLRLKTLVNSVPFNSCDGCHQFPITGSRYKCKVCEDYDLCDECFRCRRVHRHPFYRINEPGRTKFYLCISHSIYWFLHNLVGFLLLACKCFNA